MSWTERMTEGTFRVTSRTRRRVARLPLRSRSVSEGPYRTPLPATMTSPTEPYPVGSRSCTTGRDCCALISFFRRVSDDSFASPIGVYADRAAGGDRHHRRLDRAVAAGRAKGPRRRGTGALPKQPQTNRAGPAQLRE